MRAYGAIKPSFWTGQTGGEICAKGPEAIAIACYLQTSPHTNMLGLFYCPTAYICHDTKMSAHAVEEALAAIEATGFLKREGGWIWLVKKLRHELSDLKPRDNRIRGLQKAWRTMADTPLSPHFLAEYGQEFGLDAKQGSLLNLASPSEALAEPSGALPKGCDPILSYPISRGESPRGENGLPDWARPGDPKWVIRAVLALKKIYPASRFNEEGCRAVLLKSRVLRRQQLPQIIRAAEAYRKKWDQQGEEAKPWAIYNFIDKGHWRNPPKVRVAARPEPETDEDREARTRRIETRAGVNREKEAKGVRGGT